MNNFSIISKSKSRAWELKQEILALYFAYRDPRLKLLPKLIIIPTVAYALSPIYLIILPLLISLSIKLIPIEIIDELRE